MAASQLGDPSGKGLETVELATRTAVPRVGGSLLEGLPGLDLEHRGIRVACGAGHLADSYASRANAVDLALGPVRPRRAYYNCPDCGHCRFPKDEDVVNCPGPM